jgi:hypothetical protein
LRRVARVVIAAFAIVSLLGGTGAAQAFAATVVAPAKCACEHETAGGPAIDALCRCCTRDRGGSDQLPGSCCATAVAAAAATPIPAALGIADAACVGLIDEALLSPLRGRAAALELERPPRA